MPPAPLLYADQPALRSFMLPVGDGHSLHVETWGRADGIPALVLHGGPGSGCSPLLRRFFDPQRFWVVCPDQRGAGRSAPAGATAHNTTDHLLADLRALRAALGIPRWLVVGGSWGAALALAHALDQPEAVSGLLLRSTFLARPQDIAGFFREAPDLLRDHWQTLPEAQAAGAQALARSWWAWERTMTGTAAGPAPEGAALDALVQRYRIQSHYLRNGCWLQTPGLLARCAGLPPVPTLLLHGTADRVCPPEGARALHARLPHSTLAWAESAGHDPAHAALAQEMVAALDAFAMGAGFLSGSSAALPAAALAP